MKTAAVIIATWRDHHWIMDAVESVRRQEPGGWTVGLRIGVDGCPDTSAVLARHGVGHWYSETNVGPYLIRNSLIAQEPADVYVIFDGDDVMRDDYLAKLLPRTGDGIAGASRQHVDEDLQPHPHGPYGWQNGPAAFSDAAMQKIGGFRPWRCAADSDAIHRARALGVRVVKVTDTLYYRRRHPEALTIHPDTAMGSEYRRKLKAEMRQSVLSARRKPPELYVEPETVDMEWREAGAERRDGAA